MAQIKDQRQCRDEAEQSSCQLNRPAPPGCIHVAIHLPKTCLSEALVKQALIKGGAVGVYVFFFYCENFIM